MAFRLSSSDLLTTVRPAPLPWRRLAIPGELGVGQVDHLVLDSGFSLAYSHYRPLQDLLETSVVERDQPSLTITVALEGRSSYHGQQGPAFQFLAGHTTMTSFRHTRGERRYLAGETVRQLRLIVDASLLRRYALENLLISAASPDAAAQRFFGGSTSAVQRLARRLATLCEAPRPQPLELQIAALSLLSEQSRLVLPPIGSPAWPPADQQRILQARDLLLQHFDQPLTLAYLCTAVGINEFKLKQGFRDLLGTSPHRLLTETRMRAAREWLEAGERVSQVAYRVGFQHVSSFSAAFQRHYGMAPTALVPRQRSGTPSDPA